MSKTIKTILITLPKPEGEKSPYFDLAKRHNLTIEFCPFIDIESISGKEFKKQNIDIQKYTSVIFTSRHAIDHFFRIMEELKINIHQNIKYFCVTEAIALYLQKFILYKKRKVFYGADGNNKSLFDVIQKHKENEIFIYPCSENSDSEITNWLKKNNCEFATPIIYKVTSRDVKNELKKKIDLIVFFTAGAARALFENKPDFKQGKSLVGAFGANTIKIVEELGLRCDIKAPEPGVPSMVSAIEKYITSKS